ncbi:diaminopimelate epimerase [Palleniella muris]|uniref:Diaminopimelate epimerase n=1 Tax=Palleniella muris TaxID=3038145 RepID=A0AC61QLY4_9BACT|nr:diaminopimelate epimerase [Palleniella muris]TGX80141.1 diaminopimelate epimerase [Palleniella muris]
MTQEIGFTKMHGIGNDYIYVDSTLYNIKNPEKAAIAWSDRHKGIGSDGLVLIGKADIPEADFTMRIFNADGSEAMMCGNASRCIGKYLFEKGLTKKTSIRLLTAAGIKVLNLTVEGKVVKNVTVDMGEPVLDNERQFANTDANGKETTLKISEKNIFGTFVSMGNPHFVIFTDDLTTDSIEHYGPQLEHDSMFPERANIEFAKIQEDGSIRMRVWERGSGITMACGTGACATAVAACLTKRTGRTATISMDGGELQICWNKEDNHVYMTGGAEFVFEGYIHF